MTTPPEETGGVDPTGGAGSEGICELCGENPAAVHLTQVLDDQMTVLHLCKACAAEKGVESPEIPDSSPLTDFLAQMDLSGDQPRPDDSGEGCPFCGLTYGKFRETGRLGCPHCWESFETQLRGLLRRIHGSTRHAGKVYLPADPSAAERRQRLEAMRRKLERAVESEDFERAAELRDSIQELERA
jgi:protein arginine kinase activator